MNRNEIYVGTSGWNYDHWKGVFYPEKYPKSKWLEFYAEQFKTVEVNATFYRSMKPGTFDNWRKRTPEAFLWSVKASRFITHIKRLKDAEEPLQKFLEPLSMLGEKLGVMLFQFPPSLVFDEDILENFCRQLPENKRCTFEARHPSWLEENALMSLKRHNIAWCMSDTAGRYPFCEAVTSDFIYIRLHGSRKLYASQYTEEELKTWAKKIERWNKDTFVYFDNDFMGFAPKNALRLKELLGGSPNSNPGISNK